MSLRSELIDFCAVSLVVVDDDQHAQHEPHGGFEFRDPHQEPAVTASDNREPSRPRNRGPDSRSQTKADGLEGLRKTEAILVGDLQVHAGIAHEIPGIDAQDSIARY